LSCERVSFDMVDLDELLAMKSVYPNDARSKGYTARSVVTSLWPCGLLWSCGLYRTIGAASPVVRSRGLNRRRSVILAKHPPEDTPNLAYSHAALDAGDQTRHDIRAGVRHCFKLGHQFGGAG